MKKQIWLYAMGFLLLILDTNTAMEGASQGIELCIRTVIPSLFPFMVLSTMLATALRGQSFALLRPVFRLFHIPQSVQGLLLLSFLGGYPTGALSAKDMGISKKQSKNLLAFCSNAGPAFIFGMGANLLPQKWMCWAIWGIHILSALLVARLFPVADEEMTQKPSGSITLTNAVTRAVKVMAMICAWVILFRVVLNFCENWFLWRVPSWMLCLICGILELSNGCCALVSLQSAELRFILFSVLLAFGGLCVAMQTYAVTEGLDRSGYLPGKLLQALFSFLLACSFFSPVMMGLSVLTIIIVFAKNKKRIAIFPVVMYNDVKRSRRKLPCSFAKRSSPCAPTAPTPR